VRTKKPLFYSVMISLVVHIVFFASATGVKITGLYDKLVKPQRFFNIKKVRSRSLVKPSSQKIGVTDIQPLRFESPVGSVMKKERYAPKERLSITRAEVTRAPASLPDDRDYLAHIRKHDRAVKKKRTRQTRKTLIKITPRATGAGIPVKLEDLLGTQELSEEFFDKMPGFTPREIDRTVDSGKGKNVYTSANKLTSGIRRKMNFTDINENLVGEVLIYQDPRDGQKYYRIGIRAGQKALALPRITKEIVFLVDCSYSIREKRLVEFKKGLKYWLNHLNPEDRFNIMAFKESIERFRPSSVKPIKSNIKEALNFVDQMTAGKKTDTYNALYESIRTEGGISPSYIVLFSDGLPTQGMRNSRKIINEISKVNNGKISIFTFSGGVWVNRYLLDFIAYKNRGWSEYSHRTHLIPKHMTGMYEKIKDPLLTSLRYHVSGVEDQEIFPKLLPDFFRNTEFTLFGKYTGEDEFSVQLLGNFKGQTREFMIVRSLKGASKGNKEIARHWAFNKIYHLIGLLEYEQRNEAVIKEINMLCRKFNIKTPYSSNIKK